MEHRAWERVPIDAQSVEAPLSRAAVFLVMRAGESEADLAGSVTCSEPSATSSRMSASGTSAGGCRASSGSARRCGTGCRRACGPADLRPFAAIEGPVHTAPSTPGDLLFHLRAERQDMTFELERQLLDVIGDAADGGRRDERLSLLRRPRPARLRGRHGQSGRCGDPRRGADRRRRRPRLRRWQLRGGPEVPARSRRLERAVDRGAGGDHGPDQDRQRRDRRRRCAAQVPQVARDDRGPPAASWRSCATTCPFGRPGAGEFGTYFIGYAAPASRVIEQMLERMFVGVPPGAYDRLLDFSTAVTGTTFYVPTAEMLEALAAAGGRSRHRAGRGRRRDGAAGALVVARHRVAAPLVAVRAQAAVSRCGSFQPGRGKWQV